MRILLKERATGLWLKPSGRWEANLESAKEFHSGEEATERAKSFPRLDVQIYFQHEDSRRSYAIAAVA